MPAFRSLVINIIAVSKTLIKTKRSKRIHIIVCIKQVFDPEAPSSGFQVDTAEKRVIPPKGTPSVISTSDESALEAALRIKDTSECTITIISMGRNLSKRVLSKSLAGGADELLLLEDDAFENLESYNTALILATAIGKKGVRID